MAQVKISGTVTRVVEGEGGAPRRVFIRPAGDAETQEELRYIDGSKRLASGEFAVTSDDYEVGDEASIDVDSSRPEEATAPASGGGRTRRRPAGGSTSSSPE